MKRLMLLLCAIALGFATQAHASPKSDPNCYTGLRADVELQAMVLSLAIEAGDWDGAQKAGHDARADLDKQLKHALAAAKGHPDLVQAVKAYYLASKSYFENSWTDRDEPAILVKSNESKLKTEMNSKADALLMEAGLAGYASE